MVDTASQTNIINRITALRIEHKASELAVFIRELSKIIDYSQYSMEKGGEQLPLSVSTILGGTNKFKE